MIPKYLDHSDAAAEKIQAGEQIRYVLFQI